MTTSNNPRLAQRRVPVVPMHLATGLRPNATTVPVLGYFLVVGTALALCLIALGDRLEARTLEPVKASKNISVASSANLAKDLPRGIKLN